MGEPTSVASAGLVSEEVAADRSHIRNWSYDLLEREVRANLVYRAFTRIGDEKVPDAKTLARLGQLIEPKVIEQLPRRVVELAGTRGDAGTEVAGGYDGGRKQHSLSDRQQLVGGRHAGTDAHHE